MQQIRIGAIMSLANELNGRGWLNLLTSTFPVPDGTQYIGDSIRSACWVSEQTQQPIWEHSAHPGYYVVGPVPLLAVDTNDWIRHEIAGKMGEA